MGTADTQDEAHDEQVDEQDAEDDASVRRSFGPWLLLPIALAMVLLCLQRWGSVAFPLGGVFAGQTFHLFVNGFGSVSTDLTNAGAAPGSGPVIGGWLICVFAVLLLVSGVLRGLGRFPRPANISMILAAVAQIITTIWSAVLVTSQSGGFYSNIAKSYKGSDVRVTFSVGWALWLELLFGFAALAVGVGVLVRERNADVLPTES